MKNIELITKKVLEYANNFTTEQAKDSAIPKKYKDLMLSKKFGCDNVDDFILKRNYQYNNYVTIKGILAGAAEIDHRVDVKFEGFLVGFQSSTLLDSHFEVRPLRVKFSKDFVRENKRIGGDLIVEVLDTAKGSTTRPDWVRLERPVGQLDSKVYCTDSNNDATKTKKY